MKKQLFFQSAVVSTILSYLLIFVGGLVRVSGSGMGCPDWPKCFGRWIPPTNIDQIPSYIDATSFNIVLAWIEYGNRSLGVLVGFSIIVLNIIAIYYFRKETKLLVSAILSLILVGGNGGLGAIVVSSILNPFLVSLHMILALMLVSVLSYACIESYKLINIEKFKDLEINSSLSNSLIIFWILIVVEILLGTGIRTNLELVSIENPLLSKGELLNALDSYKYLHSFLGFTLLFLSIYIYSQLRKNKLYIARFLGIFILGMIIVQIFLGEMMIFFELPQLTRLFHTWGSSWLVGVIIILYNCIGNEYAK
ncbi:MAG: heme A synthase [Gammaproteobacteria bacterium]|jgi:cytochrome c oxidase assembly protein subunit 15|nr:heme A synthase [Gammaproteobacteria bacterium]MBL6911891.1 heme A synthase [Candidatus Neomarinimicrobiota bacterium]MBT4317350.1 heme A synthase [Candidatus Neomarinimicrobiota bacterium]MDC0918169.1 COX15/CtaA family protein [Candidatus Neomarinimicrobiota bacterium]